MIQLALAVLLLLPVQDSNRLRWVPNPRVATGSWVADPARHLSSATVAALDSTISALERESSVEIAVVVLDSLDGLEPAAAALLLHRRWGVGKRERDNGLVFLWSPALRRTHVSVGYGLEGVLTDARAGRIQDEHVIPRFRRGDFNGGVLAGVAALAQAARAETYSGLPRGRRASRRGGRAGRRIGRRPSLLAPHVVHRPDGRHGRGVCGIRDPPPRAAPLRQWARLHAASRRTCRR